MNISTNHRSFVTLFATFVFLIAFHQNAIAQCNVILVWEDNFDSTALDTSKWSYQIGNGCPDLCGWGNNELQYYRSENVTVSGGTLKITAKQESFGGMGYTSARLRTINKGDWVTGRFEARMKLPAGQGFWPAFWMLPTDEVYGGWPMSGEIDIMENKGHESNITYGTIHYGNPYPNNLYSGGTYTLPSGDFNNSFHDFVIEWVEDEIKWYVDGVHFLTRTPADLGGAPWRFDERFHILLNLAVGGNFPGAPDGGTPFPSEFEIDYVRVYQDVGNTIICGRETLFENTTNEPYTAQNIPGATYNWSVPSGATITSGQGTNAVTVTWGDTSGNVSVGITISGCGTETINFPVTLLQQQSSICD